MKSLIKLNKKLYDFSVKTNTNKYYEFCVEQVFNVSDLLGLKYSYSISNQEYKVTLRSLSSMNPFKNSQQKEVDAFLCLAVGKAQLLDVGCLHGMFSLLFTSTAKQDKMAIAVDVSPTAMQTLRRNISLNPSLQIYSHTVALGETSGYMPYNKHWEHYERTTQSQDQAMMYSIDKFLELFEYKPDIIKIDTEGSELFILQGALNYLQKYKPALYIEVHPQYLERHNQNPLDLLLLLLQVGYTKIKLVDINSNLDSTHNLIVEA